MNTIFTNITSTTYYKQGIINRINNNLPRSTTKPRPPKLLNKGKARQLSQITVAAMFVACRSTTPTVWGRMLSFDVSDLSSDCCF